MSREDYSAHSDMATRTNKSVVPKAAESRRVLRDHVREDQLSVTCCTVHRSHSLAERPPSVGSIEHFLRHPEVTRCGDELFVIDLAVNRRTLIPQGPTFVLSDAAEFDKESRLFGRTDRSGTGVSGYPAG